MDKIETYEDFLIQTDAIRKNFDTWDILGVYVWPNNFVGTSHSAEKIYLKEWIQDRFSWLDQQMNQM